MRDKVDYSTTFVNMDEVRGWQIRRFREFGQKKIDKSINKNLLKLTVGCGLFMAGMTLMGDASEQIGWWSAIKRVSSRDFDDICLDSAHDQGYKLASELKNR